MQARIDTTSKIEIKFSLLRLAVAWFACAGFVLLGYWMTQTTAGSARYSVEVVHLVGHVLMIFFGAGGLLSFAYAIAQSGPLITLSPAGFRDVRISPDFIAWHAVEAISTWTYRRQRLMVLKLYSGAEEKLRLTRIARMSRGTNAMLGADGLVVAASGLTIGYDDLLTFTAAYASAYGRRA